MKNAIISLLLILAQLGIASETAFAADTVIQSDKVKIGRAASGSDKVLEFNTNAGAANPKIRAAVGSGVIEFAPDGVNYKNIGSGSGSGGGGIPIPLANGDFETGNGLPSWNPSVGGIFSIVSAGPNLADGKNTGSLNASSAGQYVRSTLALLPNGLAGGNCASTMIYKTAEVTHPYLMKVLDGSSVVLASRVLYPTQGLFVPISVTFPCGAAGSSLAVEVIADPGFPPANPIYFDDVTLGQNALVQVGQASYFGGVIIPAGCALSNTAQTSPADLADGGTCAGATLVGQASSFANANGAVTFSNMPMGEYEVVISGECSRPIATTEDVNFRLTDGTTSSPRFGVSSSAASGIASPCSLRQHFSYSAAGSHTFKPQGWVSTATIAQLVLASIGGAEAISVYRYPSSTESAIRPDQSALSWSGYFGVSWLWTTSSTTYADPTPSITASFNQQTNRNFGTVSPAASNMPGITFTPPRTGNYQVCYTAALANTTGHYTSTQVVDGNGFIGGWMHKYFGASSDNSSSTCFVYPVASIAPVTLRVQLQTSAGGSAQIENSGAVSSPTLQWSIMAIDQAFPAPLLVGSVVTPSAGVTNMVGVAFSGNSAQTVACTSDPCVIIRQTGSAVTAVNWVGTGNYHVHFAAGTFSDIPICTCMAQNSAIASTSCAMNGPATTTDLPVTLWNGGAPANDGVNVVCIGPK